MKRNTRWSLPAGILMLWGILGIGPAGADIQHPNLQRGFNADSVYQTGEIDQVSLFNGNLSVTLPVGGSYEGNGDLSYGLHLVYNSTVWDWSYVKKINDPNQYPGALASADSNAGLGWRLSLGELLPPLAGRNEADLTAYRNESPDHWVYVAPSGANHVFYPTLEDGDTETSGVAYTRDGSYLRLNQGRSQSTVHFPDGMVHTFGLDGLPRAIRDAWGNELTITYGSNTWVLDDGIRQHTVTFVNRTYDGRSVPMVSKVNVAKFGGGSAEYRFFYEQKDVERPVGHDPRTRDRVCSFDSSRYCASVPILTVFRLPDDSEYRMNASGYYLQRQNVQLPYDENGDGRLDNYYLASPGVLKQMRLPTHGYLRWEYRAYRFPNGWEIDPQVQNPDPEFWRTVQGVGWRRYLNYNGGEFGGDWWYQPEYRFEVEQLPGGGSREVPIELIRRVKDPHGSISTHFFNAKLQTWTYGLPFSDNRPLGNRFGSKIFDPNGGDTEFSYVRYEKGGCTIDWKKGRYDCLRRQASERTNFAGSKFRQTESSDFDGLGNYKTKETRSNFRGGQDQVRTMFRNYRTVQPGPWDPWVLGTYTEASESENYYLSSPGQWTTYRRDTCFDLATGALLRQRIRKNPGSRGADDVIRVNTYSGVGNLTATRLYGGDLQTVGASPDLCGMGLPSNSVYGTLYGYEQGQVDFARAEGTTYYPFRSSVDSNTGLYTQTQDSARFRTDYEYDALGRIRWIKPQQGADTEYIYTRGTGSQLAQLGRVNVYARNHGSPNSVIYQEEYRYDALGRLREQRQQRPGGWMKKEVLYKNSMGWKLRESSWTDAGSTPAHWTKYESYDGFGRPRAVFAPDSPVHSNHVTRFTFSGQHSVSKRTYVGTHLSSNGTVGESQVTHITRYDGQGRVWKVEEPSPGLDGEYSYDAAGRARQIRLEDGSGNTQFRQFSYDGRGFLTQEVHPETGRFNFSEIDAGGNARRKAHSTELRDLVYEYDKAERLTAVRDRTLTGQPYLKQFEYAGSNSPSNWREGKLWKAIRWNVRRIPWNPSIQVRFPVEEVYTYGGIGGRVSSRDTNLSNVGQSFTQSWTYDALGNVKTITYPRCIHSGCSGQEGPNRTITRDYAVGVLTGIRNLATLTYHENGALASVDHSNGLSDLIAKDPWNRTIPREISVRFPGGQVSSLGVHFYDGSGNLTERRHDGGTCPAGRTCKNYYLYDGPGRLKHYHELAGGYEAYSYDGFGNLHQVTWTDTGLNPQARNIPVSKDTNRLTLGASYDVFGNLTARSLGSGSETYEYDELDMIASRNFPDETYIYTASDERIWTLNYFPDRVNEEEYTLRDLDGRVLRIYDMQKDGAVENWQWRKDHVYREGGMVASYTREPFPRNLVHYSLDHLGTPRLLTDAQGAVMQAHHYYGFGREYGINADLPGLEQRFTGHERDLNGPGEADNLDYMHARYYSPFLYRFTSPDPVLGSVSRPQSFNRYVYAGNNPLSFVDPDGRAFRLVPIDDAKKKEIAERRIGIGVDLDNDDLGFRVDFDAHVLWGYASQLKAGQKGKSGNGVALVIHDYPGNQPDAIEVSSRFAKTGVSVGIDENGKVDGSLDLPGNMALVTDGFEVGFAAAVGIGIEMTATLRRHDKVSKIEQFIRRTRKKGMLTEAEMHHLNYLYKELEKAKKEKARKLRELQERLQRMRREQ